jgi:hypothetical protein
MTPLMRMGNMKMPMKMVRWRKMKDQIRNMKNKNKTILMNQSK